MTPSIAILDGGSFVLPYDVQLVLAWSRRGVAVDFYGSLTRYNGALLDVLRRAPRVVVRCDAISGSVAPRWRGALAYVGLLLRLAWHERRVETINLQFSAAWPIELPFLWAWRRRLVFTVHNPVPHGFKGVQHRPTRWIASLARSLVFVSTASRDDFLQRYGERFRAKATVLPHGLLPIAPQAEPVPYRPLVRPPALVFWGNVLPYKGVELFAKLARSKAIIGRGFALEIHGAWAPAMTALRDELIALGVKVVDAFLSTEALMALLSRDVVFLLPYRAASQSGALYTLLSQGRSFICADVGDLGAFMRRFGLDGLLLRERSADGVAACLDQLDADPEALCHAFQRAQNACHWDALLAAAVQAGHAR